jgi:hypothetical protein
MSDYSEIEYNDNSVPILSLDIDWIEQETGRMKSGRVDVMFFDFGYKLDILKNKLFGTDRHTIFFGGEMAKNTHNMEETTVNIDKIYLNVASGILDITSRNKHSFKIQFKGSDKVIILREFLDFVNLREAKVSDGTIKQIKLQNEPDAINLEINDHHKHPKEEVIHDLSYNLSKETKLIHGRVIEITNFRIINDIWAYPNNFPDHDELKYPHSLMKNVFSFTHDEYDDVIASNVKIETSSNSIRTGGVNAVSVYGFGVNQDTHSYQGITKGGEKGNIIFMSKGKKFYELEDIDDPRGVVELVRSAKTQFYTKSDESSLEKTVNVDDNIKQSKTSSDELIQVLKMRLMKGEITKEEFTELKEMI